MKQNTPIIKEAIKQYMELYNLTRKQFGALVGVTSSAVSQWLHGTGSFRPKVWEKLEPLIASCLESSKQESISLPDIDRLKNLYKVACDYGQKEKADQYLLELKKKLIDLL